MGRKDASLSRGGRVALVRAGLIAKRKRSMDKIVQLIYFALKGYNYAVCTPDGLPGIWQPVGGNTFCNCFINYVCTQLGYDKFRGLAANDMYDQMADPRNGWLKISGEVAQDHANAGSLVIAAKKADGHGHVCLVIPGNIEQSGSWGKLAPIVINVGKDVFAGKKCSWAFSEEPDYFVLGTTV
jgi:hypothetical protein